MDPIRELPLTVDNIIREESEIMKIDCLFQYQAVSGISGSKMFYFFKAFRMYVKSHASVG